MVFHGMYFFHFFFYRILTKVSANRNTSFLESFLYHIVWFLFKLALFINLLFLIFGTSLISINLFYRSTFSLDPARFCDGVQLNTYGRDVKNIRRIGARCRGKSVLAA